METKEIINGITKAFDSNAEAIIKNIDLIAKLNEGYSNVPSEYLRTQRDLIALSKEQELATKQLNVQLIASAKQAKANADAKKSEYNSDKAKLALTTQQERAGERASKQTERTTRLERALNSEYQKRSKGLTTMIEEYRDLAIQKEEGIKLTKEETKRYTELGESINKADTALKKVDAMSGKHGREVGNYAKSYDALGNSISQLSREAPAFSVGANTGFLAISNNLPAFFDAIAGIKEKNKGLVAEGKETVSVMGSIGQAIGSTSVILSIGVTLLTLYGADMWKFAKKMWEGTDALAGAKQAVIDLNEAMAQGNKDAIKEVASLDVLYKTATNVALSTDQRTTASKKLLELYPLSFKNMSIEEIMLGKAIKSYDKLRQSIMDVAKIKAIEQKLQERALGRVEKEMEIRDRQAIVNKKVHKDELEYEKEMLRVSKLRKDINSSTATADQKKRKNDELDNYVNVRKSMINTAISGANELRKELKDAMMEGVADDKSLIDMSSALQVRSAVHIQEETDLKTPKKEGAKKKVKESKKEARDAEYEFNRERLKDQIETAKKIKESEQSIIEGRDLYFQIEIQKMTELADLEYTHAIKKAEADNLAFIKDKVVGKNPYNTDLEKANYELVKKVALIKEVERAEVKYRDTVISKPIIKKDSNADFSEEINDLTKSNIEKTKKRDDERLKLMAQLGDYEKKLKQQNAKDLKELDDIIYSNASNSAKALAVLRKAELKDLEKFNEDIKHLSNVVKTKDFLKKSGSTDSLVESFGLTDLSNMFLKLDKEGKSMFENLMDGAERTGQKIAVLMVGFKEFATAGIDAMQKQSSASYEIESKELDKQKEKELKRAGDNVASKERIEARYEKKRRKLEHDKAVRDKDYALSKAILNTAVGVTSALASYDYVSAILFGILGGVEIATIANTEIPAYAEGTLGSPHEGGLMKINDGKGDYVETVVTPDGKAEQFEGRNVLINKPKGTEVFTSKQWQQKQSNGFQYSYSQKNETNSLNKSDLQEVMDKTLGKLSVYQVNIDENGLKKCIKTEHGSNVMLNNRVSFKGISL